MEAELEIIHDWVRCHGFKEIVETKRKVEDTNNLAGRIVNGRGIEKLPLQFRIKLLNL